MADYKRLEETELMELLRQDSMGAFREIYLRYWKSLYKEAYKRLKDSESAEEVVQDIFTALWNRRQVISLSHGLEGYLYTSVGYRVIDRYRRNALQQRFREAMQVTQNEADYSTEQTILVKDLQLHIDQVIEKLPERCRSVYELSRVHHKTNKEIAKELAISEKTVENQLTKALKKLRLSLNHYISIILIFF
ncbi:RNA polymerase sigma-70 factor [Mucilaginibacter sp. RS28]|uniref:RNA polymerase sigma-70 factor n=1 Tax=Mucilaginibacter straminoryzae TaxID=2932774 RepID=A0A9X1X6X1_9SPHI|nr:RNA polymerase sigma-70 factor [Mucilaginibacter straminoryzae]MCJ8212003.1 RNA polymerase sigma-70 factor [Mucilaginibacter straminoryzae]